MKAAFTRAYNKESHLTPYSLQVVKKSRKGAVDPELIGELDGESQVQEEEEDDGVTADAMIKVDIKMDGNSVALISIFGQFYNHVDLSNITFEKHLKGKFIHIVSFHQ